MNRLLHILLFIVAALFTNAGECLAQSSARDCLRMGNKYYREKQYDKAETYYLKSVEKVPSFEGYYNLGNAYALQGKDSTAFAMYLRADSIGSPDPLRKARNYHNMGNLMYAQGVSQMRAGGNDAAKAFQDAVNLYKSSLRCNPEDNETRYNLAMAQYQLKKNQQNDQNKNQNQNQNNQDKNKDQQNQDKNKDQQDKDKNKDQNKDKQQNQDKQNKDKDNNDNKQQSPQNSNADKQKDKGGVSDQVAEQLLNSAQQDEKGVQRKVNKNNNARRRNLDKDW